MSIEAVRWAIEVDCKPMDKLVLICLAESAEDRKAWLKRATIIWRTGLSNATVKRALRKLETMNLITPEHGTKGGRGVPISYLLNLELGRRKGLTLTPFDDKGAHPDPLFDAKGAHPDPPSIRPIRKTSTIQSTPPNKVGKKKSKKPPKVDPDLGTRKWIGLSDADVAAWSEAYPVVNVMTELRKAMEWVISNPNKVKNRKQWRRFLNSWISRASKPRKESGYGPETSRNHEQVENRPKDLF